MPRNEPAPRFALLSSFDSRPFSGVLFTRKNSSNVITNVSLPEENQVVFEDVIQFLNGKGMGSRYTYAEAVKQIFTGESWTLGISEDDTLYFDRNNGLTIDVNANTPGTELFGAINATYSDGSIEFPYDWARGQGIISNDQTILFSGVFPKIAPFPHLRAYQDVRCLVTTRTGNGSLCLEQVEDDIFTPTQKAPITQWLLNTEGHIVQVINTFLNPYAASFSWVDEDFRDRLGFSGTESWQSLGSNYYSLTADYPVPGVLIPTRPYESHHLKFERPVSKKRKIGGGYTSNFVGNYITSVLSFRLDALFDQKDEYQHFVDSCGKYFYEGASISFYQDWGDTRLSLKSHQVNAGQPAYDNYYTSESNGMYGVIKGTLTVLGGDMAYETGLKRRVAVTMEIEHHG
jgi:hypothetical protein